MTTEGKRLKTDLIFTFIFRIPQYNVITNETEPVMRLLLSILLLTISLPALAQDDRDVSYESRTEIDFEALDVSGEMVKPQGSLLMERKKAEFNPLIKLRTDFNPEMSQSVNDIK
jgi:hypothetical protein